MAPYNIICLVLIISLNVCTTVLSINYEQAFYGPNTYYKWAVKPLSIDESAFRDVSNPNSATVGVCSPIFVDVLCRHGARFPSSQAIAKMSALGVKIVNDKNLSPDYASLKDWTNPFPTNLASQLSSAGQDEQYILGQRFAQRFRCLLKGCNFHSIVTTKQRTKDSAQSFFNGITKVMPQSAMMKECSCIERQESNNILRSYDYCPKLDTSVYYNNTALREHELYVNGREMRDLAATVTRRMGLKFTLAPDDVLTMFYLCGYELGLFDVSAWCSVFIHEEELRVLEYVSDVKHFWQSYMGNELIYKQSCLLVREIFQHIEAAVSANSNNQRYEGGYFQFGHLETVASVMAALGLYNDSVLPRADNYEQQRGRLFRTSKLLPQSANIAFALYRCAPENEYFMKIFVNEKLVRVSKCEDDLCPYSTIRQMLSWYIDECNFQKLCTQD